MQTGVTHIRQSISTEKGRENDFKQKESVHVLLYPYANFGPFLQARPVIINSSYFLVRENQ